MGHSTGNEEFLPLNIAVLTIQTAVQMKQINRETIFGMP